MIVACQILVLALLGAITMDALKQDNKKGDALSDALVVAVVWLLWVVVLVAMFG
jgi:hypothetical protein